MLDGNKTRTGSAARVADPKADRQPRSRDGRFSGRPRRRAEAGQSAIIAVIVLFLLLFLGAAFIALIANNLRNTQRAAVNSSSGRYAEAGIHYLDQQLTNSPSGADWRPAPECPPSVDGTCSADPTTASTGTTGANPLKIQTTDPDWFYLQPYHYDTGRLAYIGGYTRVNFGGPTPTAAAGGGRALVRITYRPDAYRADGTQVTTPTSTGATTNYTPDQLHKYIKLESVGRSGQVNPQDPTTFGNTNAIAQRVELVAYKQIGLNEYVRQITNKDNKPDTFAIGSPTPVVDYDLVNGNVETPTTNPALALRNIETLIDGPVRVNGNVAFYGVNRLYLNQNRNDALEVAGAISLNGVDPAAQTLTGGANGDPSQVYVYYTALGSATTTYTASTTSPNIYPSNSTSFTTLGGIVRDNPRGNETNQIGYAATDADSPNANLRSVSRTQPPLIDAAIGPNGLTRYRALTRDSAPLGQGDTGDNPLNATSVTPVAGQLGWGQGLYIDNVNDLQTTSTTLYGSYTPRADWLNPAQNLGGFWQGDSVYTPPAVQITLYPRYMVIQRSSTSQGPSYFYSPTTGLPLPQTEIVEYTGIGAPSAGFAQPVGQPGATAGAKTVATVAYEGYPAYAPGNYKIIQPGSGAAAVTVNPTAYYGDNVIYAEGNVRIRGVVGGKDPETGNYYQRHLTVVSNGIIYVDGNLLRDNILPTDTTTSAKEVAGKSSVALLAKSYITVNTTQFLAPDAKLFSPEPEDSSLPKVLHLNADPTSQEQRFQLNLGPQDSNNTPPSYVTNTGTTGAGNNSNPPVLTFLMRHEAEPIASAGSTAAIRLAVNEAIVGAGSQPNYLDFTRLFANNPDTLLLVLQNGTPTVDPNLPAPAGTVPNTVVTPRYQDDTFPVDVTKLFGDTNATTLAPTPGYSAAASLIGQDNILRIDYSTDASNSTNDYLLSRFGVVPLDIRIEAMMYAQEGSFFIIPGPWFNPNPNDTVDFYLKNGRRNEEGVDTIDNTTNASGVVTERVSPYFPFYQQPLDMRLTFYGEITENAPAEIGDESAWLQKFGWVPNYYGSSGFIGAGNDPRPTLAPGYPQYQTGGLYSARGTAHGPHGALSLPPDETSQFFSAAATGAATGQGILYQFDSRAISPYSYATGNPTPIRQDLYGNTLPLTPGLPVAPGFIFMGQDTNAPQ